MSPDSSSSPTKLCPTCGTRLAENAARCVVCGSEFTVETKARSQKAVQGSRMPEIRLSLPAALGFLALFLAIVSVMVFLILRGGNNTATPDVTPTETPTASATPTETETPTPTHTPRPTHTPKPSETPTEVVVEATPTPTETSVTPEPPPGAP